MLGVELDADEVDAALILDVYFQVQGFAVSSSFFDCILTLEGRRVFIVFFTVCHSCLIISDGMPGAGTSFVS